MWTWVQAPCSRAVTKARPLRCESAALEEAALWAYPTLSTLRVSASLEVMPAGPTLKEALISQDLSRQS